MSEGALDAVRVIETAGAAAELAGRLLADLGARVWKIEPPSGAPSRRVPPRGSFFAFYNAGKRSVVCDPARRADAAGLRRLLASADVWLDSTPPSEPPPYGLDAEAVRRTNPRLVAVRVTPFGPSGPHAGFRCSDLVAQAAGGMLFPNGFAGEAPLQGFGLQAYHAASIHAVIGALLALVERQRSGRGQTVDVSVQEAVVGALEQVSAAWNHERRIEPRRAPLHWSGLFRTTRCRDGHATLSLMGDWATLAGWTMKQGVGGPLAEREWDDLEVRREHAGEIYARLNRWAADRTAAEILEGAQLRRLPFAAVRGPQALLCDPQLAARGFFAPIPGTRLRFPGPPFRMSRSPLRTRAAAPALGDAGRAAEAAAPAPSAALPAASPLPAGRPLDGIRVLDFTHVFAGPLASRILADHGAEVIKVERPATLDAERRGGLFGNLNRGKQSVILDLGGPRGIALARRLAARSDVVIDNFSPRVMAQWGLDYDGLRRLRPDVIAVAMSGFGASGPRRDWVSFGPTLQALCGHTALMRRRGGEPVGWGFSHADVCAGLAGALAVVAALHHRRRTGEGQFVDLSELESVTALMGPMLVELANRGAEPERPENRSQEAPGAPHGVYRCAGDDRWVAIAVLSEPEWRAFAAVVGEPWTADPRFATADSRLADAAALDALVERWTATHAPEEVTALCQRRGVAASTVANGEDLCAHDPHLRARGYWKAVATPEGGTVVLDGVPAELSATPGRVDRPGPLHGEHTEAVLRGVLGLGAVEIAELRSAKVIA
ncbi:MAG: CoA transferase [Deltaproteobacteria bacterium]|nr:CoA transferase [Deltaproteobacteria bacterium]